jgi:type VI secretion system protein ImpH
MADTDRGATHRVSFLRALRDRPFKYDFHMAMRRLETLYRDHPRWGEAARPSDEPIRLGQDPELAFPPAMLASFVEPSDGASGRLSVRFFGLFGPQGPLPLHLTEYVRERLRHAGDRTFSAFADLFHHRLLLLFHRAWSTAQPTAAQDRPLENRFDSYVGALLGIGMASLRGRDSIPDRAKLQYVGWLANPTRSADGLQALLADYFDHPVAIQQFVGQWLELPDESRWRLGASRDVSTLGRTAVLGQRTWRCDQKFRIVLGPLSREHFRRLLPGTAALEQLSTLVRTYVGDELDWDVRLVLAEDASKQVELGRGDRLGWYARLGQRHPGTRVEDVIVHPASHRTQRSARSP